MDDKEYDATDMSQTVARLLASVDKDAWDETCDLVKHANSGYPAWWYGAVILPKLSTQAFGASGGIRFSVIG